VPALIARHAAADPAFKAAAVELLSGRAKLDDGQVALVRSAALSEEGPPALRAKAIGALLRANAGAGREAAVEAMTALVAADASGNLDKSLSGLLDEYLRDNRHGQDVGSFAKLTESDSPARRELGYAVLLNVAARKLRRPDGRAKATQDAALKVIEKGWDNPATAASLLRAVGRTRAQGYNDRVESMQSNANADVARAAGFAAERLGVTSKDPAAAARVAIETLSYEKVLETAQREKGDAKAGQELFVRQGCVACHTVTPDEPPKGPFLGGISARYSRSELAESVLKPSAKIAQGFETQYFKTQDDVLEGFVTRESGEEVEFRNAAGMTTVLKKQDIKSRGKREISVMPEGLVAKLTPQELSHLLAYLQSLPAK
jgi:putative heme-binding domain-containing protein